MSALQPVVGYRSESGAGQDWNDDVVAGPPASVERGLVDRLGYLYVVANGLGPGGAGQRIARLAVETVVMHYYTPGDSSIRDRLEGVLKAANEATYEAGRRDPSGVGGAVVTCCVVRGDELWLGHVGDCRAYIVRRDSIQQLSRDHAASPSAGQTVQSDAGWGGFTGLGDSGGGLGGGPASGTGERRLTRVLGLAPHIDVDVLSDRIRSGDRVLMCTRELASALRTEELLSRVQTLGPRRAPDALVDLALGRGVAGSLTALVISAPGAPSSGIILEDRRPRAVASSAVPTVTMPARERRTARSSRRSVSRSGIVLTASVIALAVLAPRLWDAAGELMPRLAELGPVAAQPVSGWASGLADLARSEFSLAVADSGEAATPVVAMAGPTPTEPPPGAPAQTATSMLQVAEAQRETAVAESTRLVLAAAQQVTEVAAAAQTATADASVEAATRAAATGTAQATKLEPVFPPVRTLVLTQPVKDASTSGKVVFDWTWSGTLSVGQVFELRACHGVGCTPIQAQGLSLESPWLWCPDGGVDVYRWQVVLVDTESLAPVGPASGVGQFLWTGGAPCSQTSLDQSEEDADEPTPRPTKEKAPPPSKPGP